MCNFHFNCHAVEDQLNQDEFDLKAIFINHVFCINLKRHEQGFENNVFNRFAYQA